MYRNLIVILALAGGLAALLYFKPWESDDIAPPNIYDRLPDAHIIGKSDLLKLSTSLSKTMFFYKIPFRGFLSPDFMLSQGKNYGLDIQEPVYFFMNEGDEGIDDWGILINVRDSSKVREGIERLSKFIEIDDKTIHDVKVYGSPNRDIYMSYGSDWMFVYNGKNFKAQLKHILSAKKDQITEKWSAFLGDSVLMKNNLVAQIFSEKLHDKGINSAQVSLSNDSTSVIFNTSITQDSPLSIGLKEGGYVYREKEFTKYMINLHFDIENLKTHHEDPIYRVMSDLGGKISFPVDDFLNAWDGDVAYRQGGHQFVTESYIESELDENFNVTEVVKYRRTKVPGFSLYLAMNEKGQSFLNQLLSKGILTKSDKKYRMLFSPPLNLIQSDSALVFHTSKYIPSIENDTINEILWTFDKTPVQFYLDSTNTHTLFGRVQIPLEKIIDDYFPEL